MPAVLAAHYHWTTYSCLGSYLKLGLLLHVLSRFLLHVFSLVPFASHFLLAASRVLYRFPLGFSAALVSELPFLQRVFLDVRAGFEPQLQHAIALAAGTRVFASFSGWHGGVLAADCFATATLVRECQVPFLAGLPILRLVSIGQQRHFASLFPAVPDFALRSAVELRPTAFDLQDGFRLVQRETLLHALVLLRLQQLALAR